MIEGLGRQLRLSPQQVEPSANALWYFGNTSSSSIWYSLGYIEHVQGVQKGDAVWQVRLAGCLCGHCCIGWEEGNAERREALSELGMQKGRQLCQRWAWHAGMWRTGKVLNDSRRLHA